MYRGITYDYVSAQKKFPVPVKSIEPTFPQTPLVLVNPHNKYLFLKVD